MNWYREGKAVGRYRIKRFPSVRTRWKIWSLKTIGVDDGKKEEGALDTDADADADADGETWMIIMRWLIRWAGIPWHSFLV